MVEGCRPCNGGNIHTHRQDDDARFPGDHVLLQDVAAALRDKHGWNARVVLVIFWLGHDDQRLQNIIKHDGGNSTSGFGVVDLDVKGASFHVLGAGDQGDPRIGALWWRLEDTAAVQGVGNLCVMACCSC